MRVFKKVSIGFVAISCAMLLILLISAISLKSLIKQSKEITENIEITIDNFNIYSSYSNFRTHSDILLQRLIFLGYIDDFNSMEKIKAPYFQKLSEIKNLIDEYGLGKDIKTIFSRIEQKSGIIFKLKNDELIAKKELQILTESRLLNNKKDELEKLKQYIELAQSKNIKKILEFKKEYILFAEKNKGKDLEKFIRLKIEDYSLYEVERFWETDIISSIENFPEFTEIKFFTREIMASSFNQEKNLNKIILEKEAINESLEFLNSFLFLNEVDKQLLKKSLDIYIEKIDDVITKKKRIIKLEDELNERLSSIEKYQLIITNSRKESFELINNNVKKDLNDLDITLKELQNYQKLKMEEKMINTTNVVQKSIVYFKDSSIRILSLTILTMIFLIVILYFVFWRALIKPIIYLRDEMKGMKVNRLGEKIKITSNDEIGELSDSLNQMTTELKNSYNKIELQNIDLEEKVQKRTERLEKSLISLKKTQDYLVQSEKMIALGGLVAGVAHEINTPLGIAITSSSFLNEETEEMEKNYLENKMTNKNFKNYLENTKESTTMILKNLMRAAKLVRGFKQVAVDQTSEEKRKFNVKSYIYEILESLHSKLKKTKHKIIVICSEELKLDSYPGSFAQIITNLIINSLIHGFEHEKNGEIKIEVIDKKDEVTLIYKDNGKGIAEEEINKVFDPFYTTKRGQGGIGLGTYVIYNIVVELLNGKIKCQSTEGDGVIFTINIPKL